MQQPPERIDKESVRKGIIDGFAMSIYPGDSRLVELDPDEDWDSGEIFERLQNKSWEDLLLYLERTDGPELYWYCWIYGMLTADSFYYYLPAFLVVAMDLPRTDTVGEYLINHLNRSTAPRDVLLERLSAQQLVAIQNRARYIVQKYPDSTEAKKLQCWL